MTSQKSIAGPGPESAATLRDLLLTHIDATVARLARGRSMTDVDVHEARKSIKRARAILQLLQPSLAERDSARCKLALRNAGRALSPIRDAQVIADRFDEMLRRTGFARTSVSAVAERLRTGAVQSVPAAADADPVSKMRGLKSARARLGGLVISATGWTPLGAGIRSIYRRGRRQMPVRADPASAAAMHEWRKRVKSYWHALEAFAPVQPARIVLLIRDARRLANVLGEEHDLALLAERLEAAGDDDVDVQSVRALLDATAARRRLLRRRALKIGARLFDDPPAVMEKRLRQDWQRWRKSLPVESAAAAP